MTLKRNSKAMSVISKQFELIEMSDKRYVFKHFLNIGNVPDARMFTGNSFHSRGAAVPSLIKYNPMKYQDATQTMNNATNRPSNCHMKCNQLTLWPCGGLVSSMSVPVLFHQIVECGFDHSVGVGVW